MGRLCVTRSHAVVQDWKARGRPAICGWHYLRQQRSGGFDGGEEVDALFDQAVEFRHPEA